MLTKQTDNVAHMNVLIVRRFVAAIFSESFVQAPHGHTASGENPGRWGHNFIRPKRRQVARALIVAKGNKTKDLVGLL